TAAKPPMTAITTPSAIFAAAPAARASTAPQPARTATVAVPDTVYSNSAAPANAPRKAPITLPTIGTGTPTMAPTTPPASAPQPHPPLHQLAQQRQPQHDRHRGDADGAKARERTVAHDAAHHHPQTRQPQRDQYEADHETQGEQEYRERVTHGPSPNSQTMPPWLVWRAMSRMKS